MNFFATTARGMEPLLADELAAHGATDVTPGRGGVAFRGDLRAAYAACLWSRTASRVLLELARFDSPDGDALYAGVRAIDWSLHLGVSDTLAVDFTESHSGIPHTHFGALRTKDAIVDQLRDKSGARPSVDTARPDVRVHVHVEGTEASVAIDLSGESLHRRGYRPEGAAAPLKESLAAAILLLAGWPRFVDEGRPLYDPMCGSGTLVVEAAMMARDRAPGLSRARFGFHGWRGHDEAAAAIWRALVDEANERARAAAARPAPAIVGSDEDRKAVRLAEESVRRAGLSDMIRIERRALDGAKPFGDRPGLLVANPPYGERLGDVPALVPLYRQIGDVLRRRFPGWTGAIFTGSKELAAEIGLRPSARRPLWNGPIECRLYVYPIAEAKPMGDEGPRWRKEPGAPSTAAAAEHVASPQSEMFKNRLLKNAKHLAKWAKREDVHCYRLYDADLPEYAVAVDLYDGAAHVQEWAPPATVDPERAAARLADVMAVLPDALGLAPADVHLKVRRRQRVEGHEQYERRSSTRDPGPRRKPGQERSDLDDRQRHERPVREGGLRFLVNLVDYVDTGLFLDHRVLRAMIRDAAKGRRFLNLFAYTGSATVYAAAGGARSTTSVDLSNTYLGWAQRNLALNGLDAPKHRLVRADCVAWLDEMAGDPPSPSRASERYGVILLTPPTFSNSKRMEGDLDAARDSTKLIRQAASLLDPDGVLFFSTHARRLPLDGEALAQAGLLVEELTRQTMPPDYARSSPRIHKSWRVTRGA